MKTRARFVAVWVGLAVVLGASAWAGEVEDQARAVLDQHKEAVVTVRLVVKQSFSMGPMGGEEEETKTEATGTMIGPDGLTVLALSSTDPMSLVRSMMGGMMGSDMKMDSQVSDVKILLHDGTELDGEIVLRDKDLDLAFVRPLEKPEVPMAHVDLEAAAVPGVLDRVVALNRLGKVANRVYSISFERVEAIVEKPRTFYVPGRDATNTSQGSPAFDLEGNIVGVFVMRAIKSTGDGGGMFGAMTGAAQNVLPILLPAADIRESARQAPPFEAKKEEADE